MVKDIRKHIHIYKQTNTHTQARASNQRWQQQLHGAWTRYSFSQWNKISATPLHYICSILCVCAFRKFILQLFLGCCLCFTRFIRNYSIVRVQTKSFVFPAIHEIFFSRCVIFALFIRRDINIIIVAKASCCARKCIFHTFRACERAFSHSLCFHSLSYRTTTKCHAAPCHIKCGIALRFLLRIHRMCCKYSWIWFTSTSRRAPACVCVLATDVDRCWIWPIIIRNHNAVHSTLLYE